MYAAAMRGDVSVMALSFQGAHTEHMRGAERLCLAISEGMWYPEWADYPLVKWVGFLRCRPRCARPGAALFL